MSRSVPNPTCEAPAQRGSHLSFWGLGIGCILLGTQVNSLWTPPPSPASCPRRPPAFFLFYKLVFSAHREHAGVLPPEHAGVLPPWRREPGFLSPRAVFSGFVPVVAARSFLPISGVSSSAPALWLGPFLSRGTIGLFPFRAARRGAAATGGRAPHLSGGPHVPVRRTPPCPRPLCARRVFCDARVRVFKNRKQLRLECPLTFCTPAPFGTARRFVAAVLIRAP